MGERRSKADVFGAAIVAALIALAIGFGAQRGKKTVTVVEQGSEITELGGAIARYAFVPQAGRVTVTIGGKSQVELDASLIVDGVERPLSVRPGDLQLLGKALVGSFPIDLGDDRATGSLSLRMDPASDVLTASVTITPDEGSAPHNYALRMGFGLGSRKLFVPGVGAVADVGGTQGRALVADDDRHPIALSSSQGELSITERAPDVGKAGAKARVIVTSKTATTAERAHAGPPKPARLDLTIVTSATSQLLWGRLHRLLGATVGRVEGSVTGTNDRAHVVALDEEGRPQVRTIVSPGGRFSVEAPTTAVQWFAALEASHTSAPVRFTPGQLGELRLDVSPGGEIRVRVVDADTGKPVIARLIVKGEAGTIDPNFGPDYRASGAGPLMDMLEGEVVTPLPAGMYRVSATKGLEWSIDSETIEVVSGRGRVVDLAIRHVVPTGGLVGCDLHVHARPSFDSPVTPEDRVLSLISAGIDFAVPTEHNIVGDYTAALETLQLTKQLAHVTGVEVTTVSPRIGHFGIFPYPHGSLPPARGTTAGAIFAAGHRGDPSRVVQVNHPRLAGGIGYFNVVSFDSRSGRIPSAMRTDFDTLEVYNGYDLSNRARTDQVLEDWFALLSLGKRIGATGSSDSHRIQYQWAGYPRTYALVGPRGSGDGGGPVDTAAVVAAVKTGRTFVTSGPLLDLEITSKGKTAGPGDEIPLPASRRLEGRLQVRAAPWVDVTSVEVLVGTATTAPYSPGRREVVFRANLPSLATERGKVSGTLAEASARTVRLDTPLSFALPDGARWVVVLARGERKLDDVLPFMPIQPLAFSSPVWIADEGAGDPE